MTTVRQPTKRRRSCVLTLKYTFICVYWWTRQRIHNTLIVVDRYLRLMGDKTIPDSAEPRLESFYPPFVAGIDLPHQGVVDSYNLQGVPAILRCEQIDGSLRTGIHMIQDFRQSACLSHLVASRGPQHWEQASCQTESTHYLVTPAQMDGPVSFGIQGEWGHMSLWAGWIG